MIFHDFCQYRSTVLVFIPSQRSSKTQLCIFLKLTNKEQASIFWKPGPNPSHYLKTNLADISSAFQTVQEI